jgi:GNAT superfamily N-acetyltransferase
MTGSIQTNNDHAGTIRQLRPSEELLFRQHLLELDPASRRDRFNGVTDDAFLSRYSSRCFHDGTTVVGYVVDGKVRGAAELHERPDLTEPTGEIAFSVDKDFQFQGVGAALFKRLVESARGYGYERLIVTTHPNNEAMKSLARRFNAKLTFEEGETVGLIELEPEAALVETFVAGGRTPDGALLAAG